MGLPARRLGDGSPPADQSMARHRHRPDVDRIADGVPADRCPPRRRRRGRRRPYRQGEAGLHPHLGPEAGADGCHREPPADGPQRWRNHRTADDRLRHRRHLDSPRRHAHLAPAGRSRLAAERVLPRQPAGRPARHAWHLDLRHDRQPRSGPDRLARRRGRVAPQLARAPRRPTGGGWPVRGRRPDCRVVGRQGPSLLFDRDRRAPLGQCLPGRDPRRDGGSDLGSRPHEPPLLDRPCHRRGLEAVLLRRLRPPRRQSPDRPPHSRQPLRHACLPEGEGGRGTEVVE